MVALPSRPREPCAPGMISFSFCTLERRWQEFCNLTNDKKLQGSLKFEHGFLPWQLLISSEVQHARSSYTALHGELGLSPVAPAWVLTPASLPASGILVCGNPLPRAPDFFVPQPEGQPPQDISLGTPSLPSNSLPSTCKSLVNQKKDVLES